MKKNALIKNSDEKKIIKSCIKGKKIFRLISLINQYDIKEKNKEIIFQYLKKNSLKNNHFIKINFLIVSNSTVKIFDELIKKFFLLKLFSANISYASFNDILINKVKLKKFDIIFIYIDINDFYDVSKFRNQLNYKSNFISEIKNFYKFLFNHLKNNANARIFLNTISQFPNSEFGNYANLIKNNKYDLVNKVNSFLINFCQKNKFNLIDNFTLGNKFGLNYIYDFNKFYIARIPFSQDYAIYFFKILVNLISISFGKAKKVLIFDLDNTIWGGIIGDDGHKKIEINNETPLGIAFSNIQNFILNLKKRGILLAVNSKNTKSIAIEAFKKNKNMILKEKDISVFTINWKDKVSNLITISKELNLGLDSFVFMDDSPVERELVRTYLPEVEVPELTEDPSEYPQIIMDLYTFDLTNFSKEDATRSLTYISNRKRDDLKKKFNDINGYLKSLKMKSNILNFKKQNIDRIIQLFQRSNQFNLTTIRYNYNQIESLMKNRSYKTFQLSLSDKFSKYGIISLLVCKIEQKDLIIENWVMSCRVLNRTLENFIMNELYNFCIKNNLKFIIGKFIPTQKNDLVSALYKNLGFKKENLNKKSQKFIYSIKDHKIKKTFINKIIEK